MKTLLKTICLFVCVMFAMHGQAQTKEEISKWNMEQCLDFLDAVMKEAEGGLIAFQDGTVYKVAKLDKSLGADKKYNIGITGKNRNSFARQFKNINAEGPSIGEYFENIDWTNINAGNSGPSSDELKQDSQIAIYNMIFFDRNADDNAKKTKRTGYCSDGFGNDLYQYGGINTDLDEMTIYLPFLNKEDKNGLRTNIKIDKVLTRIQELNGFSF